MDPRAARKAFQGLDEIPSGWTNFRFENASSVVHLAIIDVPPEGATLQQMNDQVMQPLRDAFDAMKAGDLLHTASPSEGQIGMMMELVVTEAQNGLEDPSPAEHRGVMA